MDVAIIDYGVGNVKSLKHSLEHVGAKVEITKEKSVLTQASALILPGVGAFEPAINNLLPLMPFIEDEIESGKPFFGICLGLQLFFTESYEGVQEGDKPFKGLDLIKGSVVKFPDNLGLTIPHMGWNQLEIVNKDHPLYEGIKDGAYVYFVHSYYGKVEDDRDILTLTEYGITFPSSVGQDNVFATQFHPEKSGKIGLAILTNFLKFVKS